MNEEELLKEATSPQQLEAVEKMIKDNIQKKIPPVPMNRKQRRALQKKMGRKNKDLRDVQKVLTETTKKIDYIDLIEKLKALNAKNEKENEENEDAN